MKENNHNLKVILIFLFTSPLISFSLTLMGLMSYKILDSNLYKMGIWLIKALLISYLLRDVLVDSLKSFLNKKNLGYIVMSVAIIFVFQLAFILITDRLSLSGHKTSSLLVQQSLVSILIVGLLAPLVEELVFRYAMIDMMKNFGVYMKVIVSSLVFALAHINNPTFLLVYFIMGLVFSMSYIKSKNIYVPIFIHVIFNTSIQVLKYLS